MDKWTTIILQGSGAKNVQLIFLFSCISFQSKHLNKYFLRSVEPFRRNRIPYFAYNVCTCIRVTDSQKYVSKSVYLYFSRLKTHKNVILEQIYFSTRLQYFTFHTTCARKSKNEQTLLFFDIFFVIKLWQIKALLLIAGKYLPEILQWKKKKKKNTNDMSADYFINYFYLNCIIFSLSKPNNNECNDVQCNWNWISLLFFATNY